MEAYEIFLEVFQDVVFKDNNPTNASNVQDNFFDIIVLCNIFSSQAPVEFPLWQVDGLLPVKIQNRDNGRGKLPCKSMVDFSVVAP